jgi:transposase
MSSRYSQSFKDRAVEKALSRPAGTTLAEVTDSLGVGYSTIHKWMTEARVQPMSTYSDHDGTGSGRVSKEKRPQDWSQAERLEMVIACGALDEEAVNALCRERGIYGHHVAQWKQEFISGNATNERANAKGLKGELRSLRKELNRKDKALAETAALLVLQKKVNDIWGNDEDSSQ